MPNFGLDATKQETNVINSCCEFKSPIFPLKCDGLEI